MTDIVERLREQAAASRGDWTAHPQLDADAADEIETLRAENKALRGSELEVLRHKLMKARNALTLWEGNAFDQVRAVKEIL